MPRILFFGNLPQTRFVATFRFALGLLSWLFLVACFLGTGEGCWTVECRLW